MQVEFWPIERVIPYDRNPRLNDQAVDAVAASLKEFGWKQPIVVDKDGVIVVGHTRWKAAKKLGFTQVPVHVATDLTPEQAKAYRLADNQTATIAEWDKELLPLELADLKEANFDLGLLGFSDDELAKWLQPVQEGLCDPDDVPAPPDEAVTKPGDLWILGDHRLLCGDSSTPEDADRLLDGAKIHMACRVLRWDRSRTLTIHHGRHTFISHALAGGGAARGDDLLWEHMSCNGRAPNTVRHQDPRGARCRKCMPPTKPQQTADRCDAGHLETCSPTASNICHLMCIEHELHVTLMNALADVKSPFRTAFDFRRLFAPSRVYWKSPQNIGLSSADRFPVRLSPLKMA
jgi:hypothetical protein